MNRKGSALKKKDFIIVGGLLLAALVLYGVNAILHRPQGETFSIYQKGVKIGTYPFDKDQTIRIGTTNICRVSNGEVYMTDAACPDGLCLSMGPVTAKGGLIVCLPNQVFIQPDNMDGEDFIDSVT